MWEDIISTQIKTVVSSYSPDLDAGELKLPYVLFPRPSGTKNQNIGKLLKHRELEKGKEM